MGVNVALKLGIPIVLPNNEDWVTVAMTTSWTTNATIAAKRMILGAMAHYDVLISLTGVPATGDCILVLPAGDVISSASMVSPSNIDTVIEGSANLNDSGARAWIGQVLYQNTTQVQLGQGQSGNIGIVNASNPFAFNTGDRVSVKFSVPLVRLLGGSSPSNQGYKTDGPSLVNGYAEGSFTGVLATGATTTPNVPVNYVKNGKEVTLTFNALVNFTKNGSVGPCSITGVPALLRPSITSWASLIALNYNNGAAQGNLGVSAGGVMEFYRSAAQDTFAAGTTNSIVPCSVTYLIL